jgi:hypothetical protein
MPVLNFHQDADPTAHENFMRWCKENPRGRFIHFGPRGAVLHRVGCPHIAEWNREEWGDLADHRKLCSDDEAELVEQHRHEGGQSLDKCSGCF